MNPLVVRRLALLVLLAASVVGAVFAVRLLGRAGTVVLAVNLVFFPDLVDALVRLFVRGTHVRTAGLGLEPGPSVSLEAGEFSPYQKRLHLKPMALAASVHNAESELPEFIEMTRPYGRYLWTIDDASDDRTVVHLRRAGCRCLVGTPNRKKPGAISELVANLPPEIETIVVFDPDCNFVNSGASEVSDLEAVVFDFQRSGMAAACPRVAVRPDGIIGDFQGFEYCLSQLLGRKSLADYSVNSGISIYRRDALDWVLQRHSLSVYAEDLENSIRLLAAGHGVYYDDRLVVETEGKLTVAGLFSQRMGWAFGHIRVFWDCFPELLQIARRGPMAAYQFVFYLGLVGIFLLPFRALGALALVVSFLNGLDEILLWNLVPNTPFTDTLLFMTVYGQYALLTVIALFAAVPKAERPRYYAVAPLFVFYSLFLIIPTAIGFLNFLTVRYFGRRIFHDHYQDAEGAVRQHNGNGNGNGRHDAVEHAA